MQSITNNSSIGLLQLLVRFKRVRVTFHAQKQIGSSSQSSMCSARLI